MGEEDSSRRAESRAQRSRGEWIALYTLLIWCPVGMRVSRHKRTRDHGGLGISHVKQPPVNASLTIRSLLQKPKLCELELNVELHTLKNAVSLI